MSRSPDNSPPSLAAAMQWVHRITSISLTMVIPAGLGYLGDRYLGISPWLLIVGSMLGMALGMLELMQLVKALNQKLPPGKRS